MCIRDRGGEEPRETGTPPPPREPRLEPAAGAEAVTPGPALRESPGSGDLPPGAAESGPSSPVPSFDSQRPGTPAGLTAKVLKPFVPQKESLLKYQERVKKQAAALESLGEPLTEGVLDVLLQRAEFQDEIFEQGRTDVRKQIRALRRLYAVELVAYDGSEDDATKMAQSIRMQALEALLDAYGQSAREIGLLVAEKVDVAPTPLSGQPPPREPRPEPAAGAHPEGRYGRAPEFQIFGTGDATPASAADTLEGRLAEVEKQLSLIHI